MRLISLKDTVDFLAQAAPRPWVQRMLLWMILDQELMVYCSSGKVQPHTRVMEFTFQLADEAGEANGPRMDSLIRKNYDPEFAEKLVGRDRMDRVDEEPNLIGNSDFPAAIDPGYFLFAKELDWAGGTLVCDFLPDRADRMEFLFPNDELFGSEFERPEFEAEFEGLCFELRSIEMLVPNLELGGSARGSGTSKESFGARGRPPKWDWEGAFAFVVSKAQTPDGLPTGPGSQARIEEVIRDWFIETTGEAPASSQIRQRATKIIRAIKKPEKPETS